MGDPAGIGPEVILKALSSPPPNFPLLPATCRIIGSRKVFELEQKRLKTKIDLSLVDDTVHIPGSWKIGKVQKKCGLAALAALEKGIELLQEGKIRALVTGPVSKESLRLAGFVCPGQTEFLARKLKAKHYAMLAWSPRCKIVFVTTHLPLKRISSYITAHAVYRHTALLHRFLLWENILFPPNPSKTSGALPRICILALNPHATEFSCGEEKRIARGVLLAKKSGINAFGPVPADAAFSTLANPAYEADGFVAMYHDQGMIPAKLLAQDAGVNVTLGLPFVRTSPLHGTAFDIAGKGIARAGSMLSAIRLAARLSLLEEPYRKK